jgi:hypothetical protein
MNELTESTRPVYISRIKRECATIDKEVLDALRVLKEVSSKSFAHLWRNETYSAADILEARGNKAGLGFLLHHQAKTLLQTAGIPLDEVDSVPPAEYTIHPDGTVTLK